MSGRQRNRPSRRFAPAGSIPVEVMETLTSRLRYEGIAIHKLHPGDYGLVPPVNPRPSKSPCDALRPVLRAEAAALFHQGLGERAVEELAADRGRGGESLTAEALEHLAVSRGSDASPHDAAQLAPQTRLP